MTTTTAPVSVETAEEELAEAQAKRDTFFAEVAAGVRTAKPADIAPLDNAITIAQLRADGARQRAADTAEAEHRAALDDFRARVLDFSRPDGLGPRRRKIVAILDDLARLNEELLNEMEDHDAIVRSLGQELQSLAPLPADIEPPVPFFGDSFKIGGRPITGVTSPVLVGEPIARARDAFDAAGRHLLPPTPAFACVQRPDGGWFSDAIRNEFPAEPEVA